MSPATAQLNSKAAGQGPALVILHGLFGNLDNFRSIALHLERHYRVIRCDLPGHGLSQGWADLSPAAMARAITDELDAMGVERCHLIGHSLGGKVAMSMAGGPAFARVDRLIIVDIGPRAYPPHHQPVFDALRSLALDSLRDRHHAEQQLKQGISDAGVRAFLLKSLYRDDDGNYAWRFDLDGLFDSYPSISAAAPIESRIECPTLFIKGGNSDYLQSGDEAQIREWFSDPSVKIMTGTGHWPHAEKPALFARLCLEFLHTQ